MNAAIQPTAALVISCEHGGHDVPPALSDLFAGQADLLATHRGWDPGALLLGREMATALRAPLLAATVTRLVVDLNRSIGHPRLFSEFTRGLSPAQRQHLVAEHYRPHRDAVEGLVQQRIEHGQPVIHIASHSFTPVLNGVKREVDVACLYDPRRPLEVALAQRWLAALAQRAPGLRLRRNHPYRGRSDGLASLLRKRFAGDAYVGMELEVNQRFVEAGGPAWHRLRRDITAALVDALTGALTDEMPETSA